MQLVLHICLKHIGIIKKGNIWSTLKYTGAKNGAKVCRFPFEFGMFPKMDVPCTGSDVKFYITRTQYFCFRV